MTYKHIAEYKMHRDSLALDFRGAILYLSVARKSVRGICEQKR